MSSANKVSQIFKDDFDLGDFVQANGSMFRTKRGEVTLLVQDFAILAKALYQLPPDKDELVDGKVVRHALVSDPEKRFRQRYVDLAVNPEVRETFRLRTETVRTLRKYLDERGFLEEKRPSYSQFMVAQLPAPLSPTIMSFTTNLYLRISF